MQFARALGLFVLAVAPHLVLGCRFDGPLRPGQEATTGGRTALTQWEFYDAVTQMYEAQVLLNIVRLVEYGEAPVHFEFSDILATITDSGRAALGFEFFDSPTGFSGVGSRVVSNPDTNVKFTPSIEGSRQVVLQAKATPVTRQNWIYGWYYEVADTFLRFPDQKFYLTGRHELGAQRMTQIAYRGTVYRVNPVKADALGALTAIVSFLSKSEVATAIGRRFVLDVQGTPIFTAERRLELWLKPPAENAIANRLFDRALTAAYEAEGITLRFPTNEGKKIIEQTYSIDQNISKGRRIVLNIRAKSEFTDEDLRTAIAGYEKLLSQGVRADPMAIVVDTNDPTAGLDLPRAVRRNANTFALEQSLTEREALSEILATLRELNLRQRAGN